MKKVRLKLRYCPGSVDDPSVLEAMDLYRYSRLLPGTPVAATLMGMDASLLEALAIIEQEMAFVEFNYQVEASKRQRRNAG